VLLVITVSIAFFFIIIIYVFIISVIIVIVIIISIIIIFVVIISVIVIIAIIISISFIVIIAIIIVLLMPNETEPLGCGGSIISTPISTIVISTWHHSVVAVRIGSLSMRLQRLRFGIIGRIAALHISATFSVHFIQRARAGAVRAAPRRHDRRARGGREEARVAVVAQGRQGARRARPHRGASVRAVCSRCPCVGCVRRGVPNYSDGATGVVAIRFAALS
jgi:hypothetical protein